jgi:sigma-B regulation protein RsbU (phosphoserine phosphatase)
MRRLDRSGLILGAFGHATFDEETLQLERDDTLVAFSDGISEALNADGEEFGDERLVACVESHSGLQPATLLDCILDTVQRFRCDAVQSGDLSVLILRYLG